MTNDTMTKSPSIGEEGLLTLIRTIARSIRPAEALENASLAEIVHNSLQHMRFVVAIETLLIFFSDNSAIMDLRFDDEQRLARDLGRLVTASKS